MNGLLTYRWLAALAMLTTLALARLASAELTDDRPWGLKKEKDGIKIYVRKEPGSDFEAFKAEVTLDASIQQVMAVMSNPGSCLEWVHGCIVSYGFDDADFNHRFAYSVNDLPWPVKDRDYVLEIRTFSEPESGDIIMDMRVVEGKKPEVSQYTRMTVNHTIYRFSATADNKTRMLWLQHTEPAGTLPSWLVNALAIDIPYNSLRRLQDVTQWEKYQGFSIVYDDNRQIVGVSRE